MKEIIDLINEMSPYLLLGFLLAGLMHAFIPGNLYQRYLGGNSFRAVLNAALLGIPLPLCSCGVIPTAMSLHKQGASKGATVSFLIATPQTGVDSIIATYSLMGLPFALARPLAALATSLLGGELVNLFNKEENETNISAPLPPTTEKKGFFNKIGIALNYAFVEMMQDIGRWLILGLIIAGLITVFVPESFFALFADNSLISILLVLLCAIPMYICATGSIPIAVALMLKGLSPGTALVLLMAGPAANAASILVINKVMGKRTLILYLLSIIGGAVTFGLGIDYLLPREWFTSSLEAIKCCAHGETSYFNIGCTILLFLLLIHACIRRYLGKKETCCKQSGEHCDCHSNHEKMVHIKGMSCNHCRTNVEKAIKSLTGVESVEVNLASGTANIKGDVKIEDIRKAVESIGFEVTES
ncbi:MAG: permease [Bacteroidaceae bacterium]|nr:permease [Bacteroidaceae bacterium]